MKLFSYAPLLGFRGYSTKITSQIINPTKPITSKSKKIEWTDQQVQILDAIENHKSVFITGPAGTGKTMLIQHIIKLLRRIHGRKGVFVTASTGVAACALRGQTLHSFAGVGLAEASADTLLSRVLSNRRVLKRWKKAKALVIDEISMVTGELFDKLEHIARGVMRNGSSGKSRTELPWGGIQLVVSGDFLQLPPIIGDKNSESKEFAFEADSWDCSFQLEVELQTIFRQSDPEHIRLLQSIRRGKLNPRDCKLLKERCCAGEPDEMTVSLFPRVEDVDRVNQTRLHDLGEEVIAYEAFDTGKEPWKSQLNLGIAPAALELCKGARVMLIKNLDVKRKLVNGATGTITGFVKMKHGDIVNICRYSGGVFMPIVKFDSGCEQVIEADNWDLMEGDEISATRFQLPLMLAWAITIHKSQGMTVDRLHTNVSRAFGYGMIYVALSRVRSLEGLYLSGFRSDKVMAHPKVLEYYQKFFS